MFAAAFAAALILFLPGILEGKTGSAPPWLIATILIFAALYLVGAGVWAFRALRVGTYHRLDAADLVQIWRDSNPTCALIRETFTLSRMNYRAVNEKVSCIKMVHEFMARSFVAFGILMVVEAGWEAVHSVTEVHWRQVIIDLKREPKPAKDSATGSTPDGLGAPRTNPPNSGEDSPIGGAKRDATKSGTNLSSQPAANVGAISPGVNASVQPGANGSTSPSSDTAAKK